MAAINGKELPSGMLVSDQIVNPDEELSSKPSELLSSRKPQTSKPGFSVLLTLLSPRLARSTLLLWIVFFGNSFAYYGVVLLTSELSSGQNKCGSTLLHINKSTDTSLYKNVFITSFAEFLGLILSAVLVDRIGRKFSLILMYLLGFIFLLPLMFHQHELLTTCLLFGARMCMMGTFTVAGVYCPEIYPTSVRTRGVGVAVAMGRIAGMICPLVAVGLVSGCHQMVAGISVLLFPLETKGRELIDVPSGSI